jgi:hypothetical protein
MPQTLRDRVVDKFTVRVRVSLQHYKELMMAVSNKKTQASLETELSEQFVLSIAVHWESFLSDLILAYVLMDPDKSMKNLRSSVMKSIEDKFGASVLKCTKTVLPKKLTKQRAQALLDTEGWNITAKSAEDISSKASKYISGQYAKKFTLGSDDSAFIDFVIAMRNYLSHRSVGARRILAMRVSSLASTSHALLFATLRQVGPYLKDVVRPGMTRAEAIADGLSALATKL